MAGCPLELIRGVPFFADLSDEEAATLSEAFVERRYGPGEVIIGEGQLGMSFFVLESGTAGIAVHGRDAGRIGPGQSFGELSLFEKEAVRAATITALDDVRAWSLPVYDFRAFVEGHPAVSWKLLEHLAERLRESGAAGLGAEARGA